MNSPHLPIQDGGVVLCGVTDSGDVQGMSREQMDALETAPRGSLHRHDYPSNPSCRPAPKTDKGVPFLLVEVPQGHTQHDSPGGSYHRGWQLKTPDDER